MTRICYLIVLLLILWPIKAQIVANEMDSYLETALEKFMIPNLEVIIVNKDSILYTKSISTSAKHNQPYFLGSISKS